MTTQSTGTQEETIVIGLGEMQVTKDSSVILACLGLGSCICVCTYDPVSLVGGMSHIVLPSSDGRDVGASPKYADIAIPLLLEQMRKQGALKSRLIVKLAGGAELSRAPGIDKAFEIGRRNLEMTKKVLAEECVRVAAEDTGGNHGRTVRMFMSSGKVIVSTAGTENKEL